MKVYTAQELEEFCNHLKAEKFVNWWFWFAEIYSIGKYMRKYGYYPQWLPLCVHTEHGVGSYGKPCVFEGFDYLIKLFHSKHAVELFKKENKDPCFVMSSPQVFYRKSNKISKTSDAKGTIVFPTHSCRGLENEFNRIKYINELKALPEEFQPVSICLHCNDIIEGEHKIYIEHGLNVYTAGLSSDHRFIERFYDILKCFKYSTSNYVGSQLYYSVEMGIPFFLYGEKPCYKFTREVAEEGECLFDDVEKFERIYNLFKVPISDDGVKITEEQKQLVIEELGLKDGLSRLQMFFLLYWALLRCCVYNILTNNIIKIFLKSAKYCMKNLLKPKQIKERPLFFNLKNIAPQIFKGKKVYLYGAGIFARKIIEENTLSGFEISGIFDSNISKKGQKIGNYEIFHKDEILDLKPDVIILCIAEPNLFYYDFISWLFDKDLNITVIPDLFEEQRKEFFDIVEINNNFKGVGYDSTHMIF